jgi:hypothetical protein
VASLFDVVKAIDGWLIAVVRVVVVAILVKVKGIDVGSGRSE